MPETIPTHGGTPEPPRANRNGVERPVAVLARAHIEANFRAAEGCGTAALASQLGVSQSGLCHRYRAAFGETIGQHVRRLRIAKAREMLRARQPVLFKEVAAEVGYQHAAYRTFLNAFRAETGMSPSAYLKHVSDQSRICSA